MIAMVMRCVPSEICCEQEENDEHQLDDSVLKDDFNAWLPEE
jgi:hypothetical protein